MNSVEIFSVIVSADEREQRRDHARTKVKAKIGGRLGRDVNVIVKDVCGRRSSNVY